MTRKLLFFCLFAFLSVASFAQESKKLSGTIKDTTSNSLVKNAVVALLSQSDSVLVRFTRTNNDGAYTLPTVAPGKYIFTVMHPAFADYVEDIDVTPATSVLPLVAVTPKSK